MTRSAPRRQRPEEQRDLTRIVLPVGVEEDQHVAHRALDPEAQRVALAAVVLDSNDSGPGLLGPFGGPIGRAVVDDQDLVRLRDCLPAAVNDAADGAGLVVRRQENRDAEPGLSHARHRRRPRRPAADRRL